MQNKKEIYNFAIKYYDLYSCSLFTESAVINGFAEQCSALGFEMDCGKSFIAAFSNEAFRNNEDLKKIINNINDIALLGSAIFSRWRDITHWEYASLLSKANRSWFITAFTRLIDLTVDKRIYRFEGTLRKIRLVSNNICYGPMPKPNDEVEQRLTITADGRVWLSRYRFTSGLIEKRSFSISAEAVKKIMDSVSDIFKNRDIDCFVTDSGSWKLALTNTKGKVFDFGGSLCNFLYLELDELSDLIRAELSRDDLFVFDGNPDYVTRIEIGYHRRSDIMSELKWRDSNHTERLTIDRASQTLEYIRELGPECKLTNTYYLPEKITYLLDSIWVDDLSEIEGDPPDALDDPNESKEYTLSILTKHEDNLTMSGTFDKNGLPVNWEALIENIFSFVSSYGYCELFDKTIYGKAKRRKSDLIFCNVTFEDDGQTYSYIADSDDYCEGDLVIVPAGRDNHEAVVRIESIEYRQAEAAPFPLEKTKHILRKYKDDDEDDR